MLARANADNNVLPKGMTLQLQPSDICMSEPFLVRREYELWLEDNNSQQMPSGLIKRASVCIITRCISNAWEALPPSIVSRAFMKCCLANSPDGTVLDNSEKGVSSGNEFINYALQTSTSSWLFPVESLHYIIIVLYITSFFMDWKYPPCVI